MTNPATGKPRFTVNIFPAVFNDASQGTIVSITYQADQPMFPPKLSALKTLAQHEFNEATKGSNGRIVTNTVINHPDLNFKYTVAAIHIPKGHESPKTIQDVELVVNNLNLAFGN